jgi:hypothetical protein
VSNVAVTRKFEGKKRNRRRREEELIDTFAQTETKRGRD